MVMVVVEVVLIMHSMDLVECQKANTLHLERLEEALQMST
jgi:hypothetical protein